MAVTQAGQPVVAVQGLTKTFKDFWMRTRARAVDGVSFEVRPGEIFGLLGPNGSGKSTTIKIVLGLLHQTGGRVAVFGRPPSDVGIKKRIGYLPEESYLYPFLNARETLDYYGKLFRLGADVRRRRTDELLEMVGLGGAQYRPVREYSKGMQRRLGIAQALINDPDLLILDEPTTGLDPLGTRQVKDLILELGRRRKTIILSSHLLADVEDTVDRMVILYGGKVREEGTCESLLTASDRTVIETEALDEGTIARIDQLIRASTGGRASISRVSKPRQRLEDKFVAIVEAAAAARAATSGAGQGGQTAGFLRADAAPQGQELLRSLSADAPDGAPALGAPAAVTQPTNAGPDRTLLQDLAEPSGAGVG
ncbi:MAG: ABC transporter ATP-binding protein, partial [Planctomyces sp.]|nr:ABC transporter ATP-binding protein [Planctomyces sp.]